MSEKKSAPQPILHGHVRKGKLLKPPLIAWGVSTVEWKYDILPEIIWLAEMIERVGFDRALFLATRLITVTHAQGPGRYAGDLTLLSTYIPFGDLSKRRIVKELKRERVLDELRKALSSLLRLYPLCPLSFLFPKHARWTESRDSAVVLMRRVIAHCYDKRSKLPMQAQAIYLQALVNSGQLVFAGGVTPIDIRALRDFSDPEKVRQVGGYVRAIASMVRGFKLSSSWKTYFWRRGLNLGPCEFTETRGIRIREISMRSLGYFQKCFGRYSVESLRLFEEILPKYRYDLAYPVRDEVLLGLANRIYRLTIQIVSFAANWSEDIGEVFARLVSESFIYFRWFQKKATLDDFKKFREYGLGQQKLFAEHIRRHLETRGLSQEQIDRINPGLNYVRQHRLPEMLAVNLGFWAGEGYNLRRIAEEAGESVLYSLVYAPTSAAIHGMFDCLDRFYLTPCVNPFHGFHEVPYYWDKSPLSRFGYENCLMLMDDVFRDLFIMTGRSSPKKLPGRSLIKKLGKNWMRRMTRDEYREFRRSADRMFYGESPASVVTQP